MACRHVMSSERISYTVTQTVHLLGTQAFVITVAQPFCHTKLGSQPPRPFSPPLLFTINHLTLPALKRVWWVESMQSYLILILDDTPCPDRA